MTISDKTRKILWGKSGNRCAICNHELIVTATNQDMEAIVGDECHIISPKGNGPRHDPSYPSDEFDYYENLILLCRVHHKMIDDQENTFSTSVVKQIKMNHEASISEKLTEKKSKPVRFRRTKKNIPDHLVRFTTGTQIFEMVFGSDAYYMKYDELKSESEVKLVGEYFQNLQDLIDLGDVLEPMDRVNSAFYLTQLLGQIEESGLLAFGAVEVQYLEGGMLDEPTPFNVLHLAVLRNNNENIFYGDHN